MSACRVGERDGVFVVDKEGACMSIVQKILEPTRNVTR